MHFQWYPGHMTKAKRMMQENIKLIDLVIELVDARLPVSSRNPDIDELGKNKARLILLNKADLAEEKWNDAWAEYFKKKGYSVVKVNSKKGGGIKSIQGVIQEACKEKIERDRKRGILNRPVRAMVVGIPNVGKSTFINALAGKACAKTGNKPGVTKGKQWIKLNKNIELLDTPGILWPKFEDQQVGLRLALIGSIRDEILNQDEMAIELIEYLKNHYQGILADRYQVDENEDKVKILEQIALNRNCKMKGNELDYEKASKIVLEEFRNGKLGKISLETPEEGTKEA
jgi:ribosome biogenesis GTPase A